MPGPVVMETVIMVYITPSQIRIVHIDSLGIGLYNNCGKAQIMRQ